MSSKRQDGLAEAVRNAATGYAAVVLGIVCFLLALAVIMAGVRIVAGSGPASGAAAATAASGQAATATRTA